MTEETNAPAPEVGEVVARLRHKTVFRAPGDHYSLEQLHNPDGPEAAGLIEAQAQEVERLTAALKQAHMFVVLFLAFDGRDRGTDRTESTLDSLCKMAIEVDRQARAALAARTDGGSHEG